jgi:3-oxoacyl-[acyl-carrier protein] reductase
VEALELRGAAWLVTGGGTGLGRAIALAAARGGADVAVNYSKSRAEAEATVAELQALGAKAAAIQGDVATEAASVVDRAAEALGRLDVLVNNAGTTVFVPFRNLDGISEADWDRVMAVNVRASFLGSRAAAKHMTRGGAICNIASIGGLRPAGSSLVYSVSKAALIHLTRGLAVALAPKVRVNCVAPGLLDTRWTAGHSREFIENENRNSLLGHIPTVDDTAAAAVALCLNESVTGQVLAVDSGATLHH